MLSTKLVGTVEEPKAGSPFRFKVPVCNAKCIIDSECDIKFSPPMFRQRYETVQNILLEKRNVGGISKIVDLGCSELSFFRYVKYLGDVFEYICVDVDLNVLEENVFRVVPLAADFLSNRSSPFKVQVLHGSATDPDVNLRNSNVIFAIELIEHLFPDTLEALPYNIFGLIQPEVVVFTTPNSDFNPLFKNLIGFRHSDHKFEWSRAQFKDWAENLVVRYPNYEVDICGVGPGPPGTEEYGCCSQLALFFRRTPCVDDLHDFKEIYSVVKSIDYPYQKPEEKTEENIRYLVENLIWKWQGDNDSPSEEKTEIPLSIALQRVNLKQDCNEEQLRNILVRAGYKVDNLKDGSSAIIIAPYESSESSFFDDPIEETVAPEEETWDLCPVVDGNSDEHWGLDDVMEKIPFEDQPEHSAKSELFDSDSIMLKNDSKRSILRSRSFEHFCPIKKCKTFRFSLNIESDDFSCDKSANVNFPKASSKFEDSYSQSNKAVDSGYPNSFSQEMEMDLTPEQVDEITMESESSLEGNDSGDEHQDLGPVVRFQDNVENGDVANNNRDGEGNNLEDNQLGEPLEFHQLIRENEDAPGNLAMAENEFDSEEESSEIKPNQPGNQLKVNNFPEWLLNICYEN